MRLSGITSSAEVGRPLIEVGQGTFPAQACSAPVFAMGRSFRTCIERSAVSETPSGFAAGAVSNVQPSDAVNGVVFPWMTAFRDGAVSPDGAHPLAVYWAMPRRVQIVFTPSGDDACSLTGERPAMLARECRITTGTKLDGWTHPFSPYHASKNKWLPVRGQTDRIGYRDWLALVHSNEDRRSALAVAHVRNARWLLQDAQLVAYGFASTNTLVTGWCSSEMPLVLKEREIIERTARALVDAADDAAKALAKAVNSARDGAHDVGKVVSARLRMAHALGKTRKGFQNGEDK